MKFEDIKDNPVARHAFEFALMIEKYCSKLYEMRRYDLARQLFRSGTSIGANIFEAQHPESNADFIHKMKIAQKEATETLFWLMLCDHSENYPDCKELLKKLEEISKLLSAIITTAKKNSPLSFFIGHLLFLFKPTATITLASNLIPNA
jgi:four helix bundle protein